MTDTPTNDPAGTPTDTSTDRRWLQCNIGLGGDVTRRADTGRQVFARLAPELERLVATRDAAGWFFQRKPPDIRLRISCSGSAGATPAIVRAVEGVLEAGAADELVREAHWSDYRAEIDRFGGPLAMDLAHAHFHDDSLVWCRVDQCLAETAGPAADPTELRHRLDATFAVAASVLLHQCFEDAADRDAAWAELGRLTSDPTIEPRALFSPDERNDVDRRLRLWLGTGAASLLPLLTEAANRTRRPFDEFGPSVDRHRLAALLVHFDANRWGVDGTGQRWMAETLPATPLVPSTPTP